MNLAAVLRLCTLAALVVLAAALSAARITDVRAQTQPDLVVTCRIDPPILIQGQPATLRVLIQDVPINEMVNAFNVKMFSKPNKSLNFLDDQAAIGSFLGSETLVLTNILGPYEGNSPEDWLPDGALIVKVVGIGAGEAGSGELFSAPFTPTRDGQADFQFIDVELLSAGNSVQEFSISNCSMDVYRPFFLPMINPAARAGMPEGG